MRWGKEKVGSAPTLEVERVCTYCRKSPEREACDGGSALTDARTRDQREVCVYWRTKLLSQDHLSRNEEFSRIIKEHPGILTAYGPRGITLKLSV